jgi:hypothetical protein
MASFFQQRQDAQVHNLCKQLAEAVEVILSPNSSHDKRMQATTVGPNFKGPLRIKTHIYHFVCRLFNVVCSLQSCMLRRLTANGFM